MGGERELSQALRYIFPNLSPRRGQQFAGGPDSPDIVGLPGIHIECKRTNRLNLASAMRQATEDACDDAVPTVFSRSDYGRWLVTCQLADMLAFARLIVALSTARARSSDNDVTCYQEPK